MFKKNMWLVFLVLISLSIMPLASAAPTGGQVTAGASERGTESSSQTVNAEGGNVTYVDVTGTSITGRWAGFYGNVSGGIKLTDSSANSFFEWTVSNVSGAVVYATSAAVSDWTDANIVAATNAMMPSYVNGTYTDNFTNTFAASEAFTSASITEASTPYAATWQSGAQGTLKTYALHATAEGANIFAGKAQDDVAGFKGTSVDYQIIVPAQSSVAYNFYLELP